MSILVVGSVALDSIKTPFGKRKDILGGSATFFSIAASFFDKVNIVAAVGEDFPEKYLAVLKGRGIGLGGLEIKKGAKTFRWSGEYNYDLNTAHTIATHLNVFKDSDPKVPTSLRKPKVLFLANIDPDLQLSVLKQVSRPKIVACDSMNYWIETKRKSLMRLLKEIDIFLLNDGEARLLTGETNLLKAAQKVLSYGPKAVIVKKGEHGVMYFSRTSHFISPAYLLETVRDPTGAGDTFAGGMIGYLSTVKDISNPAICRGIVYGSILASFTVEDFSIDRLAKISMSDIRRRYDHFKKITRF
ncbi:MAG: PfkB family carbohydrate kinase [Candidatus Omnitrophota bacterium]